MPAARRVLLKLSGEAFGGGSVGLDPTVVRSIAEQMPFTQGSRLQSSSVAVTFSVVLSSLGRGLTAPAQTTWECSEPS